MNARNIFSSIGQVIKLSVSNIENSIQFYTDVFGMTVDQRYTLHSPADKFCDNSYVQLNFQWPGNNVAIGLYKDIEVPFPPISFDFSKNPPPAGTVPTFIVTNIKNTYNYLLLKHVQVSEIISNTSDSGFIDCFAFFTDVDNNLLCLRQDIN